MAAEVSSAPVFDGVSVRMISFSTFLIDAGWEDRREASR